MLSFKRITKNRREPWTVLDSVPFLQTAAFRKETGTGLLHSTIG